MSKEQAKGFFEAISKDKQLAAEVKEVLGGQATNQEKAKELLSLAKAHNFNFTEDELKTSLSIDDLADVSGGMWSSLGRLGLSVLNMLGVGGGGNQPAPQPVAPIVNVQQAAGNAQNEDGQQENEENEILTPAYDDYEQPEDSRTDDGVDLFELARRAYSDDYRDLVQRLERLERIYPSVRNYMISSRTNSSEHYSFDVEIKEWLELICDPSKNVDVSLQDLIAEADFFIEQATEAVRSRLKATLPELSRLAEHLEGAKTGFAVQQRIIKLCEKAREIVSIDDASFEQLQELLEEAYTLRNSATAVWYIHFCAPTKKPIRIPTFGELRKRLEREGQVQHNHELEEGIAQALHELNEDDMDLDRDTQGWFSLSRRVFSNVHGAEGLVQRLERLERIYPRVRNYIITSRTDMSRHAHFEKEIKEWLELICDPSKNVDVSLQDLLAEADFFIEQVTEATRSRLKAILKAILPGIERLSYRMRKAKIGDAVQQQIVDFCENARAIASAANVSFEELQESLDAAYNLGDEATAIINSHFAPAPKPETAYEENEVEEIRELTPEEIAERQRREDQERRELEARLAQGPLELEDTQAYFDGYDDRYGDQLAEPAREVDNAELTNRVNRLNTLYYRLLYAPQGQELMERIRNYIATVGFTFDRSTASLQEQISIADALIHEAEEMLQRAEQQLLREESQHGLDTLALILQRTHTGIPSASNLYIDVKIYFENRENYSREERVERALRLMSRISSYCPLPKRQDDLLKDWVAKERLLKSRASESNVVEVLEEGLEEVTRLWLTHVRSTFGVPGEHELAFEIQKFFDTLGDNFTDEHLAEMNRLLDRAREMMMNRARAYTRFDTDQLHILNNDLQLAQMLGIDKEYIQEKIKNKSKMSAHDITGTIELPDDDTLTFNFMVGSGTLVLTGSGNTVIDDQWTGSLWRQLKEAGLVFEVTGADGSLTDEQLPTRDYPFVVRNLIIGNGITKIGTWAFDFAISLRSVYLMGPVRFVDYRAFSDGGCLVEVGFAQPEKLERIYPQAFQGDLSLVSINIPQNADIAKDAFYLCVELKKQGCPYCKYTFEE